MSVSTRYAKTWRDCGDWRSPKGPAEDADDDVRSAGGGGGAASATLALRLLTLDSSSLSEVPGRGVEHVIGPRGYPTAQHDFRRHDYIPKALSSSVDLHEYASTRPSMTKSPTALTDMQLVRAARPVTCRNFIESAGRQGFNDAPTGEKCEISQAHETGFKDQRQDNPGFTKEAQDSPWCVRGARCIQRGERGGLTLCWGLPP